MKYISNFKKITNLCIRRGWLTKDPFIGFKMTKREVERGFLTEQEIRVVAEKKFPTERLNNIRDVFLNKLKFVKRPLKLIRNSIYDKKCYPFISILFFKKYLDILHI